MAQTAVKDFFTGGSDELLDEKIYRLAESQDFRESRPPPY